MAYFATTAGEQLRITDAYTPDYTGYGVTIAFDDQPHQLTIDEARRTARALLAAANKADHAKRLGADDLAAEIRKDGQP